MALVTRRRVEAIVVIVLAVALGVLAFTHKGVPAADVELHDGGVWVTNQNERLVGHLNYESETIDGALRASASDFDLTQSAGDVLVKSQDTLQPVDVASLTFQGEAGVAGVLMAHGGDQVLYADQAEGRVWATDTESAASFSLTTEPLLKGLDAPRVAVGPDGVGYVLSADGVVRRITGSGAEAEVSELSTRFPFVESDSVQLTVVGQELAVLDGTTLNVGGRQVVDAGFELGALQQPSAASSVVVVATPTELIRVDIASGQVAREQVAAGVASAPVQLGGCTYGLWASSGYYVRDCGGDDYEKAQFDELAQASAPVFRTNRNVIVINDVVTGDVYLPLKQMIKVDNWELVASQLDDEEKEEEDEETDKSQTQEFTDEQRPPEAVDDELGARPGTSTTLPVLINDIDMDGDVLTAVLEDVPDGVNVSLTNQGRAVRIDLDASATGTVTFTYRAFDGFEHSNVATVTVSIRSDGGNSAPQRVRENTINISERATANYSVLADWVDPEGDPIFLAAAETDTSLELTWRPDGYVQVHDTGEGGPGHRAVNLTVSDGTDAASGELGVQVAPGSTNAPPVANNDYVVATVGEPITMDPRRNDTDPDSDDLQLVEISAAPASLAVAPDYQEGTISIQASAAGSYMLVYGISDGSNTARGRIRVDAVDPNEAPPQPVAENDLGLLPDGGSVVVDALANDYDPAGGVLVIQGYSLGDAKGLQVEVVRHSLLRITAPAGLEGPQTFTYTVSNGHASTTAKVMVVPKPTADSSQPPVAIADSTTVRAGDLVTVPVLVNDYSPADLDLKLTSTLDVRSDPALGEFFLADGTVRFRAGTEPGVAEALYTVADSNGALRSATVTITIKGIDEQNQPPVPKPLEARTFAGSSTRILIPLDGIDPDGDSVTLVGPGDQAPSQGAITIEGNYIVYQAAERAAGTDTFTYRVQDRFGAEGIGTVRVGVAPAPSSNQRPVAVADEVAARPATRLEIPALKNDFDPDGDQIEIVADSVVAAHDSWQPEITVKGQRIVVVTPSAPGTYQLVYSITDSRGMMAQAAITLTVDPNVPPVAPLARDDVVLPSDINGVDQVEVPVLENDSDPDGAVSDLAVTVESPATVRNGTVVVPVAEDRQIYLYTVTDVDGLQAKAAIVVPGRESPPQLDTSKGPAHVVAGETLTIRFEEWVLTRPGRSATLTSVSSVAAGPGGAPEVGAGGVEVINDHTLQFTPARGFFGVTSVSFEVTDGESLEDPTAMKARINLTVKVVSAGQAQPQVRPNPVSVAPAEAPQQVSLSAMVDDPDPGDNEKLAFSLIGVDGPVEASVVENQLSVAAPSGTAVGSTGTITVEVSDGTTTPVFMDIPVTVISSTRPLMMIPKITDNQARVGETSTFDLAQLVTNPFADVGGAITLVGSPQVKGSATASANGAVISVTPTEASADAPSDIQVNFRLADATGDPARERTGVITLSVKDVPRTPTLVKAEYVKSQTARVTWSHAGWRGATPKGFLVRWSGGSKDCGLQTTCDIEGLTNGQRYTFTVTAQVTESDLNERSQASAPSNEILVDVLPDKPGVPTAVAGDGEVALSWHAPSVPSGGSPVTRYTVTAYPGGHTQTTSATSLTWTGLSNGTSYSFTVSAHNALTDANMDVAPPTSDASNAVVPMGAPSGLAAPTVSMDPATAGVQARATISWSPPSNPNGSSNFTYQVTNSAGNVVCPQQSGTSCTVYLGPSTEDLTFQVSATNSSGKWSAPSPASNAVRPFQAPSAPSSFEVRATGNSNEVDLVVGEASAPGLSAGEITYRWSAGGYSGTVSPGTHRISSPAFAVGQNVTVTLTAVATVLGQTVEGGSRSASVMTYTKPQAPSVTTEAQPEHVVINWNIASPNNGAQIRQVRLVVNGEVITVGQTSGSIQRGDGRGQRFCVQAQALNEHGMWGDTSAETCVSTWAAAKATLTQGTEVGCPDQVNGPCYKFKVTLSQWTPGTGATCYVTRARDQQVVPISVGAADANGNASGESVDYGLAQGNVVPDGGIDITAWCQ